MPGSWADRIKTHGACLAAVLVCGCPRGPQPDVARASATFIEDGAKLLYGPSAMGAVGDVRIENEHIVGVITAADRAVGFAVSGGNLIDLTTLHGEDHLNQMTLYLNDQFPRQANYASVKIVAPGSDTAAAVVRAKGKDTKDARIAIETDYVLEPGARYLEVVTRFTFTGTATLQKYRPGDAIQWGRAEHMGPGVGFDLPGKRVHLPWVAGLGKRTSYAWVGDKGSNPLIMSGSMWSDPIGDPVDLEPGKTVSFVRYIAVGFGDTASLATAIAKLHELPTGRLAGRLTDKTKPIANGRVTVETPDGKMVGIANTDQDGRFGIDLEPGEYQYRVEAPGRETLTSESAIKIAKGKTVTKKLEIGPSTSIRWRIESDVDHAVAVKITILGIEGTESPRFGPAFYAAGARQVVLSSRGVGRAPVGVGKYRVIVSRGPEYETIDTTVTVGEGESPLVTGRLSRSVDTIGFVAAELHQHAAPSFDSGVSLEDRAISNAAEGVEVMVSTEHNVVVDYRPVIAAQGLGRSLFSIIGTEATTHSVGHFNAFPLTIDRSDPRGGMKDPEGWSPKQIFDYLKKISPPGTSPFIQTNHPRAGHIGYFDLMKLDPKTGRAKDERFIIDIDGAEVLNFGFPEETKQSMTDWYALLRRGARITATGNSDSHTIYGREVGWARTMVCMDDDTPYRLDLAKFIAALKAGCATVSAGPFVTLTSGKARMGDTIKANKGRFDIQIDVQAPGWVPTDTLELYVNGKLDRTLPLESTEVRRFSGSQTFTCKQDCFVTAMVHAQKTIDPVVSTWRGRKPKPVALTNPIFVDVDGDGLYLEGKVR